jgi:hypothetical protein
MAGFPLIQYGVHYSIGEKGEQFFENTELIISIFIILKPSYYFSQDQTGSRFLSPPQETAPRMG